MNTFLNGLKENTNYTLTENLAVSHSSTLNDVLDMFAFGGAYRNRSDEDCIVLFKNAYEADPDLALKCLFYLGDCRGGQGERRFFRTCYHWLAKKYPEVAKKNLSQISEYRRWDDLLYVAIGTPIEEDALKIIKLQLALDVECKTPSLLGKWLPSLNTSSLKTKAMANIVKNYLGFTNKEYRKTLSELRKRINVLEKLMSAGRWDEIEFDKIPSKAGMVYRNAFATKEVTARRYKEFMKSKETKVNASVLNPVDIAHQAFQIWRFDVNDPTRVALSKYWKNLPDYYDGKEENGICVVDTSGSMSGLPMEAAVSLGAYIAERGHGPFANHFITFSSRPQLVKFQGIDIVDKFHRCKQADWGMNTNLEAVFDLMLDTILRDKTDPLDIPSRLYIFSDMEFDYGLRVNENQVTTLIEAIEKKWNRYGYQLPEIVFWNLNARHNLIPAVGGKFSYISGFSPVMIQQVLQGKTGIELMLAKLNSERYSEISA